MEKKYKLSEAIEFHGAHKFYRIQALKDFGDVKAGEIGGWVESEDNLSQEGLCWVYDDATVMHHASVSDNAICRNHSIISGNAIINQNAQILDDSTIEDNSIITNDAVVMENSLIKGNSCIHSNAVIRWLSVIDGKYCIGKDAYIRDSDDFFMITNVCGQDDNNFTFYLDKNKNIFVNGGEFNGELEKFIKSLKHYKLYSYEYRFMILFARQKLLKLMEE